MLTIAFKSIKGPKAMAFDALLLDCNAPLKEKKITSWVHTVLLNLKIRSKT